MRQSPAGAGAGADADADAEGLVDPFSGLVAGVDAADMLS